MDKPEYRQAREAYKKDPQAFKLGTKAAKKGRLDPGLRRRGRHSSTEKPTTPTFQRAMIRWLTKLPPEEHAAILRSVSFSKVSDTAKKAMFLELYREKWPGKQEALEECGLCFSWLKEQCRRDVVFATDILEIELSRVDAIKKFSYEQCFVPENSKERMFWLSKIAADEFGDAPMINLIASINNGAGQDSFEVLEKLLERRRQLVQNNPEALTAPDDQPNGSDEPSS